MACQTASLSIGRLCGTLLSCASNGSVARPWLCLAPVSALITANSGWMGGSAPPFSPGSGPCRPLASTTAPEPVSPSPSAADTRETWRPGQGFAAASASAPEAPSPGASSTSISAQADSSAEPGSGSPGMGGAGVVAEMDEVFTILQEMGLQPGRHCVVGEGLADVEVGLYLNGVKVALDMEATRPSHTMASDARSYAMKRAARSVLQAHGWHPVTLVASDWHKLDGEQKAHYLAHCINHALGMGGGHGNGGHGHGHGGHGHQHQHGGCCGGGCGDASRRH